MLTAACGNESGAGASSKPKAPEDGPASVGEGAKTKHQAIKVARVDGEITAVVNGSRSKWYVTRQYNDDANSSASKWRDRTATSAGVTIVGHKAPTTTTVSGAGEIVLDFAMSIMREDAPAEEVRIDYFPMGLANAYSSNAGGSASVVMKKVTLKDGVLELEGAFSGTLPFMSKIGATAPRGMTEFSIEDGVFSAKIRKQ